MSAPSANLAILKKIMFYTAVVAVQNYKTVKKIIVVMLVKQRVKSYGKKKLKEENCLLTVLSMQLFVRLKPITRKTIPNSATVSMWLLLRPNLRGKEMKQKKQYLNSYLLQQSKIGRLKQMIIINPDLKDNYEKQIKNSNSLRNEIEQKIAQVDDGILSEILFQKYILGRPLEEVALVINYSKRQTERLHIKALEKFKF